jgi:transposase-like protein
MKRKRHTAEQIIGKLREAEAILANGGGMAAVCQKLGVAEQTFYRWRAAYGGMKDSVIKRVKRLEVENVRLKKAVADLTLDNQILKEALDQLGNG